MVRRAVRRPFATVVLVVRDAETHIVRALESVLNQDFDDIQVVVSDHASHDRTCSMCRNIAERDIRLDVVENDSSDFSQAFDAAIAAARGRYVLPMAQDDWLAPGSLAKLAEAVEAYDLQLAIMALSLDEQVGAGERASHVLRFSVEPTDSAAAFRDETPLFVREGVLGFLKAKLFDRDRIDELGLRMSLQGSQTAFLMSYIEGVERAGCVEDALYHAALGEVGQVVEATTYQERERDHGRMLELACAWHREHDGELMRAIHQLHMRQVIASIEQVCALRGISSIERSERVRDIVEAPSTRASIEVLGETSREFGFMYASIVRKNVAGCCLSARFAQLARISRLPIAHGGVDLVALA